jgi:hypothetical protein
MRKEVGIAPSKRLLSDPNVRRWYANLKEGSEFTADTHLRKLRPFCELHKITPQESFRCSRRVEGADCY